MKSFNLTNKQQNFQRRVEFQTKSDCFVHQIIRLFKVCFKQTFDLLLPSSKVII
jgi:hypothetical protein